MTVNTDEIVALTLRSEYLFPLHQSVTRNLSDMWRSTFEICTAKARRSFAPLQKSRRNHRSYGWTDTLSGMVIVPAQKLSGRVSERSLRDQLTSFT